MCKITFMQPTNKNFKKCIFYSPVLNAEPKWELLICVVTQLLQIAFCSLSVIWKLKLHMFFFSFNLPSFRSDPF